ncbi:MAG TPA: ABC transporter substrate-binding protein [Alphaproteobacteria bacterium]|nr:ABC transporter substrate-binding protein [Alphaproteobacteria bacterium]
MAQVHAIEVAISCGAVGIELELCRSGAEAWARDTGNRVKIVSTPNDSNERLALYQQLFATGSKEIDVFQIDVIWPGTLADHLIDLRSYTKGAETEHVDFLVENNTINGELKALPWFLDLGLLYYRTDLLEAYGQQPPRTWEELTRTATLIQEAERSKEYPRMWGYVWQGRAYEGLTCNALEWLASQNGGRIVDENGSVTVANPRAAAAIDRAASWVGSITPPGVLNYAEEDARGIFQSGNAVFMRNWPYAWSLAQGSDSPVRGKVGVAPLPASGDGQSSAALGGWQLAVSRYSTNPEAAASLALYLTGAAEQKRRAIEGSFNPTRQSLYKDSEIIAANPLFAKLGPILKSVVARPSTTLGSFYSRVSAEFWQTVHTVLAGQETAEPALERLQGRLEALRRRR